MIIWDEIEYGKKVYNDGIVKTKKWQTYELKCLAKYLMLQDKSPKEIRNALDCVCGDNIKYLTDKQKTVIFNKIISQCKIKTKKEKIAVDGKVIVKKHKPSEIVKIHESHCIIYKNEISQIRNINNEKLERILYVLLVYKKWLGNLEWIYINKSDLFNLRVKSFCKILQ